MTTADLFLAWLWERSWHAAVAVGVVLVAQAIFRRWLSPSWRCGLWALVLLQVLLPHLPASRFSLFQEPNVLHGFHAATSASPAAAPVVPNRKASISDGKIIERHGLLPPEPFTADDAMQPEPPRGMSWMGWVFLAWLAGVGALGGWLVWSNVRFARDLAVAERITAGPLWNLLGRCSAELGIRRPPELVLSDAVAVPALAGLFRPKILLPPAVAASLSFDQLRLVFVHELCHLKRHDIAVDWLCTILNIVHWFNPALWLARHRFRAEREMARDAMVLTAVRPASEIYGGVLLQLVTQRRPVSSGPVLATMLRGRRRFQQRIHMIAGFDSMHSRRSAVAGVALFLLVGCGTLTRPPAPGESPQNAPASSASGVPVTRTYDIRPLLIDVPDFAPPDMSLTPATQPASQRPTREQLVQQVMHQVRESIDPNSWGGACGMKELSGQLVVTQTAERQQRIGRLLAELSESHSLQIHVKTWFVRLDPKTAKEFGIDPDAAGETLLDSAHSSALLSACAHDSTSAILTAPRITLFNGQRAWALVATQRAYVSDIEPVLSQKGGVAYSPTIDTVDSGVTVDVRASAGPDRKAVSLQMHQRLQHLDRIDDVRWPGSLPGGPPAMIQLPTISVRELNWTGTVPSGQTLALTTWKNSTQRGAATRPGIEEKLITASQTSIAVSPTTATAALPDSADSLWVGKGDGVLVVLVKPEILTGAREAKTLPLLKTRDDDKKK